LIFRSMMMTNSI